MWFKGVENRRDVPQAVAVLTLVAEEAKEPLASRASYYLGIAAIPEQNETKAQEYLFPEEPAWYA